MSTEVINREVQLLQQDALISLYILDATELGGGLFRFYAGTLGENQPGSVSFNGQPYTAIPMEAQGFDITGQGAPPRPTIVLANIWGQMTSLVLAYGDLVGAKVTRKRTFRRFLDDGSSPSGLQALPDEVFYIERKVRETFQAVEFELTTSMEVDDVLIPRRQILANLCLWTYRGPECGYANNGVVADIQDNPLVGLTVADEWDPGMLYTVGSVVWVYAVPPVRRYYVCVADDAGVGIMGPEKGPTNGAYWTADQCSKKTTGCKMRFQYDIRGLPFGGFPATARINR